MHSWAAIFDWDGVILDSSSQHDRAWQKLAGELGRPLPDGFFRRSFGMKNERVIPELLGWTHDPGEIRQLSFHKEELYREMIGQEGIAALPGVEAWLDQLRAAGIPCAVGSSTPRANIDCVIQQLGLESRFAALVCAEDVTHGKPHPEVFLLAASRLATPPARCVVFEDAHVGVAAARAAGMKVVALPTTHPASSLADADRVVQQLDELSVAQLSAWFCR